MARTKGSLNKKQNTVQIELKEEVNMSDTALLEMPETEKLESMQSELDLVRVELEKAKIDLEEKRKQIRESTTREIDEKEMKLIEKQISNISDSGVLKEKIARKKSLDNVKVTGKFINRRAPGQPAKLTYQRYGDDPVKWYTFEDGKVYTIPRGFADEINEHYHTPVFNQKLGAMDPNQPESQIHSVDTSNKKYSFVPINF